MNAKARGAATVQRQKSPLTQRNSIDTVSKKW